ncbi:MAG: T9SS type A sorting domain-containing protein [Ginsengibacter sp.]
MKNLYSFILSFLIFQSVHSQSNITIGTKGGAGTYYSSSNAYGPFSTNTTVSWNRHAYIYPQTLLNGIYSNSTIDSLLFPRVSSNNVFGMLSGAVNCKIYLKNTVNSDFGSGALDWTSEISGATPVYSGDPSIIIGNTGGFKKFILSAPFIYSGDNLEMLVEYTQSAPATGEVVWGFDLSLDIPDYVANSTKYISGTSGLPTNLLSNSTQSHPAFAVFFTSNNPIDANVISITDPSYTSCFTSPVNFSVALKNSGNTAIAAGTAAVTLKINGANSFVATRNNVSSIAPDSIENIIFSGVNLSNPGSNDDTAFVVLAGDAISENDTIATQTSTASTITTFPVVEDVEGSLPLLKYVSSLSIGQAWFLQTGDYTNADQTTPLSPHGGANFFLFDSYDYPPGTKSVLYSNCLTLGSGTSSVEFYMSHDDIMFTGAYLDSLYLSISTDKGVSWTRLKGYRRYDPAFTTPDWKMESVDLTAFAGLTVQIGFEGVGDFGNSIGLDDIVVSSTSTTPVTLLSLNAKRYGLSNLITWATSQELNSQYFGIERSTDGINFSQIGKVAAAGNSSIKLNYQFVDPQPVKGINYYRLKVVDIDNAIKYSLVRNVKNIGTINLTIYPNPVKDKLLIDIDAERGGRGEILITDLNGRRVYANNANLQQGGNTILVDVASFASGTYFVRIHTTDISFVKKFNKQ